MSASQLRNEKRPDHPAQRKETAPDLTGAITRPH